MNRPSDPLPHYGPPRNRRRRKRIITLRNFAIFSFLAAVVFAAVTLISEHYSTDAGEHGRLYRRRAETVPVIEESQRAPVAAVTPLQGSSGADPLLLDAAKREQYLGVGVPIPMMTPDPVITDTAYRIKPDRQSLPRLGGGVFRDGTDETVIVNPPASPKPSAKRKIVISGGSDGVELRVD